jgi:hypothetical protein
MIREYELQAYVEYEGMIHENVTRFRIVGRTFGLLPFMAGPFQTEEEAEELLDVLNNRANLIEMGYQPTNRKKVIMKVAQTTGKVFGKMVAVTKIAPAKTKNKIVSAKNDLIVGFHNGKNKDQ